MSIINKKNIAIELLELLDPTYKAVNFHPLDCDIVGVILVAKIKRLVKDMRREELTGNDGPLVFNENLGRYIVDNPNDTPVDDEYDETPLTGIRF
jgi:hypothetical protein